MRLRDVRKPSQPLQGGPRRRQTLLMGLLLPLAPSTEEEVLPRVGGSCPTCIVGDSPTYASLASCTEYDACLSTYDDRPDVSYSRSAAGCPLLHS